LLLNILHQLRFRRCLRSLQLFLEVGYDFLLAAANPFAIPQRHQLLIREPDACPFQGAADFLSFFLGSAIPTEGVFSYERSLKGEHV
jgi:hypothetical protein